MKAIAVSGSLAFDTILMHPKRFSESLDKDKLDAINVAFTVPQAMTEFGGTAGNIAYNLRLLQEQVEVLSTVGRDGDHYVARLEALGARTTGVRKHVEHLTAHAYIMTDAQNNQMTAFHPGALGHPLHAQANSYLPDVEWAIVAPDNVNAMVYLVSGFAGKGVRTVFDPGQALPMFTFDSLSACINKAAITIVNDYEFNMLQQKLGGLSKNLLRDKLVIVTRGADGVDAMQGESRVHVGVGKPDCIKDATGCGDSFRAGLLYGLRRQWGLTHALQLGATMGAVVVSSSGGQSHSPHFDEIVQRFERDFDKWPDVMPTKANILQFQ